MYTCTMVQAQHKNTHKQRARHRGRVQLEVLRALRAIRIDGLSHAGARARDTPVVLEGVQVRSVRQKRRQRQAARDFWEHNQQPDYWDPTLVFPFGDFTFKPI